MHLLKMFNDLIVAHAVFQRAPLEEAPVNGRLKLVCMHMDRFGHCVVPVGQVCRSLHKQPFNLQPLFCQPEKRWVYSINPPFFQGLQPKKNPSFQKHFSRTTFLEKWLQNKRLILPQQS